MKRFGAIVLLIVILTAGFLGYRALQKNNPDNQKLNSNHQTANVIKLLGGQITFANDGTWKEASGGYWSIENQRCGRGSDPDPGCLDHKMLILSSEEFANPDQFQVNLIVFDREGISPKDWESYRSGSEVERLMISGHEAYRTIEDYGTGQSTKDEKRITYNIAWEDKMIVLKTTLFNGNHNSYKSSKDYSVYKSNVEKLIEGLEVTTQ